MRFNLKSVSIALGMVLIGSVAFLIWQGADEPKRSEDRARVALMTSLPIYWSESADISSFASGTEEMPWVREVLEQHYQLVPLDSLSPESENAIAPLDEFDRMLLVQPRGLSPSDNAVLDRWVRSGGHLLYALDPMLTGHYSVPIGDPRHPTLIGLVPPVVLRWGLTLQFSDRQPFEMHDASYGGGSVPVQLAGEVLKLEETDGFTQEQLDARGECRILGAGIGASCQIGDGQVTLIADAALFELHEPIGESEAQLINLIDYAFESAG